jgi:signal transduction histidine kinase
VENPFIFLLGLHIAGASTLLGRRAVYGIASLALLMVGVVVTLELCGAIPHHSLVGFFDQGHYREPSYLIAVLVALTSILYLTAFMSTAISRELNQRQREIVKLREILLDETTEELSRVSTDISKLREERDKFLRFLGMAAHDLKAPLTAIQGYFRIMLEGYSGKLTKTQKHYIERSSTKTTDLLELISDLLDIPRIETGRLVVEMAEISLPELIKNSFTDLQNLAKEKGIALNMEVPETLPRVYGSEPRLVQVLTNLGSNSVNYTDEGSITCRVSENRDEIKVEVIDTGIGIPPQDLPHVFEDFFRASNTQAKGTGLGLSISERIVEAHGGRIWVESPSPETGTGCKFVFTLPKRPTTRRVKKRSPGETLTEPSEKGPGQAD